MGKAEQKRRFILERIAPIFNVKGFAGTSLSDMTAAAGLTKGSIYRNFGNKDEVAMAAFGKKRTRPLRPGKPISSPSSKVRS